MKELKEAAGREEETVTTGKDVLRDEEDLNSNTDQPSEPLRNDSNTFLE